MKTLNKVPMQLIEVEFIPDGFELEENKFYYSEKYLTGVHLCACGCGQRFSIPIKDGEWQITNKENLTITPSLWHRIQCRSHYIISNGFANITNYPIPKEEWGKSEFDTHAPNGCPM